MNTFATISKLFAAGILTPVLLAGTVQASTDTRSKNGLVAYVKEIRGKSTIWTVKANGAHHQLIASNAKHPAWSPDGRTLVFTTGGSNTCNTKLVILDAFTMKQQSLVEGGCIGAPAWSANSMQLAFPQTLTKPSGARNALFTVQVGTHKKTLLAGWSATAVFRSPSWSPDSKQVVFEQYDQSSSSLFIKDLTQNTTRLLTTLSDVTVSSQASWSPTGKKIAYADSSNEIYTIWPDGTHRSVISDGDSYDATWSPDGTQLLFLEDRSGEALSVSQPDGTVVQLPLLLSGYTSVEQPSWSPDSSKALLAATTPQGRKDLISIDLKNSQSAPKVMARNVIGSASWQAKPY